MDSLIAKADALGPPGKKRKTFHENSSRKSQDKASSSDRTLNSVAKHTSLPKSLRPSSPVPDAVPKHSHIANKKLRAELTRNSAHIVRSKALLEDAELLLAGESGGMQVEGEMERTWRIGQEEIVRDAGQEAATGRREWKLDGGPYRSRYTRNGRSVLACRSFNRSSDRVGLVADT